MRPAQYFDRRTGRELSATEALRDGVLRDGVSLRVHMNARDSARAFWDAHRDSLLVIDARAIGGTEGNKPGFRVFDSDVGRADREAAYREHEEFLRDAWKSKPRRDPEEDDNDDDDMPLDELEQMTSATSDRRMPEVDAMSANHQRNMARIYDSYAAELSEAWRKR